jgi:hypothetical protein
MPYGATEADLRAHFSGVGAPSQIVIPVDRETGRPRGSPVGSSTGPWPRRPSAVQQPFMGRSLGERSQAARAARWRIPAERRRSRRLPSGRRVLTERRRRPAGRGRWAAPAASVPVGLHARCPAPGRNFGPPKKKSAQSEKLGEQNAAQRPDPDALLRPHGRALRRRTTWSSRCRFDDPASSAAEEDKDEE